MSHRHQAAATAEIRSGELAHYTFTREETGYFGTCPDCGRHAEATTITRVFLDDRRETETIARCGLPCGWTGPAADGWVPNSTGMGTQHSF